jgi:hypothetical protein
MHTPFQKPEGVDEPFAHAEQISSSRNLHEMQLRRYDRLGKVGDADPVGILLYELC